ncbi:hypothetical protein [Haloferula sp. BvORR071]|uniref:hypothetical protein n=1 Tax=Haloferula sp. BvORR071 TaxID=1396141 RepID=UPI0005542B7D|nr:hypothetical protein [Haloferula sp. BvORR071]
MNGSVTLTEGNRSRLVSLGKPYRYDVFGVAGKLTLGNSAASTVLLSNQFREKLLGLIPTGAVVNSTAYVTLQTGLLNLYPERLSVSGSTPGTSVGPRYQYGPLWTLSDPQHKADVNLNFHLVGSGLLGALLSVPSYYNLNPSGYFYVLGEYHAAPPVMTGTMTISSNSVLNGSAVPISFQINRKELPPVYRPPFLGLDLGDLNLTVLGTPPSSSQSGNGGLLNLPAIQAPDLLSLTIDLSGLQGQGWKKVSRTP